ncbi:hypothetical protein DICPUDRAFT_152779 [Dictyostelium purpureum]|uniref:Amine oxidase n=1 Tax=Dictyostelium purpureum TaxID=5786 RepID=F0ZM93_DICPU|nr:uncharacterized protein DICPUDRAFT_152779 [Dictyostelium purpureum]EGC34958.1 hypothetical protein DICPUDRAFT_152779 [Dictyostelium purpureum]|eukprot:XP_003288539.1 hypothetical protein DICPUDRAFT_152779 [Dictyostelium purpureum]
MNINNDFKIINTKNNTIYNCIIIGGGLSGLNCAYKLKEKGLDSFLLLEARNRFGGRTETIKLGKNKWIELGGQWIGSNSPLLSKLVKELNLKTYKQYYDGKTVVAVDSITSKEVDEDCFSFDDFGIENLSYFIKEFDLTLSKINFKNLNNSKELVDSLDALSVHDWLISEKNKKNATEKVLIFFDWVTKMSIASSSKDISVLFFMKYIKSVGSLEGVFMSNDQTTEYERVIGGSQLISERMAQYIGKKHFRLNSKVIEINQTNPNNLIKITTETNRRFYCRKLIVTIPPALTKLVSFYPKLPLKKKLYISQLDHGNAIKVVVVYKTAFWREKGYSGKIISFEGPIKDTFDNCTHDNRVNSIVGFIVGSDDVKFWSSKTVDERKHAILSQYAKYWGVEALHPIYYNEKNWNEDSFSGGCFTAICAPDANYSSNSSDYPKPFKNIHWAGTETSNEWERVDLTLNNNSFTIKYKTKIPDVTIYFNDVDIEENDVNSISPKTINEIEMDSMNPQPSFTITLKTINKSMWWIIDTHTQDIYNQWVGTIGQYKSNQQPYIPPQQSMPAQTYLPPPVYPQTQIQTPQEPIITNGGDIEENSKNKNKKNKKDSFYFSHECKFKTFGVSFLVYSLIWCGLFVMLWYVLISDNIEKDPVPTICTLVSKDSKVYGPPKDNGLYDYEVTYTFRYIANGTEITSTYYQIEEPCIGASALKPGCVLRQVPSDGTISCYFDKNHPRRVWIDNTYESYRDLKQIFIIIFILLLPLLVLLYYT